MADTTWVLGLTGGIGSGKSTVAAHFISLGVPLTDLDVLAREVVLPGSSGLQAIIEHFGNTILQEDGSLDRTVLREKIFSDAGQRQWLEGLLHPLIRERALAFVRAANFPYAILESPLLVESGQYRQVDRVLVVDVPEEEQARRAALRDGQTDEQIRRIMAVQASREQRLSKADDILLNDRDLSWMRHEVERLHHRYLGLKGGKG